MSDGEGEVCFRGAVSPAFPALLTRSLRSRPLLPQERAERALIGRTYLLLDSNDREFDLSRHLVATGLRLAKRAQQFGCRCYIVA